MERLCEAVIVVAVAAGVALVAGHGNGPAEQAAERGDQALAQARVSVKGLAEKAEKTVDRTVATTRR